MRAVAALPWASSFAVAGGRQRPCRRQAMKSASARPCPTAARCPASAHRAGAGSLFREGQRRGRHQRPQDQVHHPRRRLLAAQDRRADPQAGRAGRGADDVRLAGHRHQQRRASLSQRQEGAAAVRAERRHQMGRPEEFPVDHAGHGGLRIRGRGLCQVHPADQAGRQDRDPVAERRFRPRLCRRLQARAGRPRPRP